MNKFNLEVIGLGEVAADFVSKVPHFPEADEKVDAITQDLFAGGVTANYCVGLARLGGKVGFYGAVGDDDYGNFLINDFKSEKVSTQFIEIKKGAKSALNLIVVSEKTGEKFIVQSPFMYSTRPNGDSLDDELFDGLKLVHSTAIYPDLTEKAFKLAKKFGVKCSLDLEKQIVDRFGIDRLRSIIKNTDILLPNKEGAMQITNTKDPIEAGKKLLSWGVSMVVITLGHDGAAAITSESVTKVDAMDIQPIDTTGAGDTFCAAFSFSYILKECSLIDSLKFANAAAALKCLKLGARTGMPGYGEVIKFMKTQ